MLINGREKMGIKNEKKPNAFNDYSQNIDHVYENLEDYNLRMLIVFDDKIADMESNKILIPIVTELFLRGENSIFHLFLYKDLISKSLKL